MGGAHLVQGCGGAGIVADGAGHARAVDLGGQGRRNADQTHRLARFGKGFSQCQHLGVDAAAGAFHGKVRQVLGRAKTARHDQRVKVCGVGLANILHGASSDARGFHQHIARLGHFFAREVVDHVQLRNVGCKAFHLSAALVQAQQGDHAFMDLCAVVHATAGKDHCNLFAHGHFS